MKLTATSLFSLLAVFVSASRLDLSLLGVQNSDVNSSLSNSKEAVSGTGIFPVELPLEVVAEIESYLDPASYAHYAGAMNGSLLSPPYGVLDRLTGIASRIKILWGQNIHAEEALDEVVKKEISESIKKRDDYLTSLHNEIAQYLAAYLFPTLSKEITPKDTMNLAAERLSAFLNILLFNLNRRDITEIIIRELLLLDYVFLESEKTSYKDRHFSQQTMKTFYQLWSRIDEEIKNEIEEKLFWTVREAEFSKNCDCSLFSPILSKQGFWKNLPRIKELGYENDFMSFMPLLYKMYDDALLADDLDLLKKLNELDLNYLNRYIRTIDFKFMRKELSGPKCAQEHLRMKIRKCGNDESCRNNAILDFYFSRKEVAKDYLLESSMKEKGSFVAYLLSRCSEEFMDFVELQEDGTYNILYVSQDQLQNAFVNLVRTVIGNRQKEYRRVLCCHRNYLTEDEFTKTLLDLIALTPLNKPVFPQININWGNLVIESCYYALNEILPVLLRHPSAILPSVDSDRFQTIVSNLIHFSYESAVAFVRKAGGPFPDHVTSEIWNRDIEKRGEIVMDSFKKHDSN